MKTWCSVGGVCSSCLCWNEPQVEYPLSHFFASVFATTMKATDVWSAIYRPTSEQRWLLLELLEQLKLTTWLVYTFVKIHDYKWTCDWSKASDWWGKEQYWHAAVKHFFLHCLINNKFLAFKNLKTFCLAFWYIGWGAKVHVGWNPSNLLRWSIVLYTHNFLWVL